MLRFVAVTAALTLSFAAAPALAETKPIKVLIVSGGCCHDYPQQREILETGLKARLKVEVSHLYYDPKPGEQATRPKLPLFSDPNYGDGYDVIVHNECAADESDPAVLDAVLAPHQKGVPGVNLHCAMHSYRSGAYRQPVAAGDANARWFEYVGIQSSGHGPQSPITLSIADAAHPITRGLSGWTTTKDELYNNLTQFGVTPLITGIQPEAVKPEERSLRYTVAWTHSYGPKQARVFSTTLAHNEANMREAAYLDLVARGVAWATGHLTADGQIDKKYAAE
ncbi:ThuA domain-containing protein [Asticcacaulis sp. AND118]|uniref:ThuA domain-containing protein n=1 Tax=Asticcacaulis sp. AND118 TaxID=2840468 RepID=UPI001CFF72BD|nr:ThuA domain-containing protein [Asticcacaulis sp. AND118]UDF03146.1 ThuA domain-containing protein [Asticcacaulis sp. AND118]